MFRSLIITLRTLVFIASIASLYLHRASAQGVEYIKAHYTKYEYRIPVREGKRLFTAVYVPKDQSRRYPIMLTRAPYSVRPCGADKYPENLGPSPIFAKEGYIFAYQDVRGRWMSEGKFVNMRPHLDVKKVRKTLTKAPILSAGISRERTPARCTFIFRVRERFSRHPRPETSRPVPIRAIVESVGPATIWNRRGAFGTLRRGWKIR